jgi:hypothetical protein
MPLKKSTFHLQMELHNGGDFLPPCGWDIAHWNTAWGFTVLHWADDHSGLSSSPRTCMLRLNNKTNQTISSWSNLLSVFTKQVVSITGKGKQRHCCISNGTWIQVSWHGRNSREKLAQPHCHHTCGCPNHDHCSYCPRLILHSNWHCSKCTW